MSLQAFGFKKLVCLKDGSVAEVGPQAPLALPFRCDVCNTGHKTRQGLAGHKSSKEHMAKVEAQGRVQQTLASRRGGPLEESPFAKLGMIDLVSFEFLP
ncbi:MAG: hypothetical protein GY772_33015, partial [bacterium]|nr:hypothetical protein [bacterium]